MSRRTPHPALSSLVALALLADTAMATRLAWHSTAIGVWLTAAVVAYAAMLAGIWALVTAWHAARMAPYRRARKALYRPSGRPRPGTGSRPAAPVDGRHARAMAAVAAQPALPARDGQTVVMPMVRVPARDWAGVGR